MKGLFALSLLLSLTAYSTVYSADVQLSQNDVSILIPLPTQLSDASLMLKPTDSGKYGVLFPRQTLDRTFGVKDNVSGAFNGQNVDDANKIYSEVRVVAIRLDPCAPQSAQSTACKSQIRLIWQPIQQGPKGVRADDLGAHISYDVPDDDFKRVVSELRVLKSSFGVTSTDEVLGVNPQLKKQGLNSAYAKNLFEIILSAVGESRVSRITYSFGTRGQGLWLFIGYNIIDGQFQEFQIPRSGGDEQAGNHGLSQTFQNCVLSSASILVSPPDYFDGKDPTTFLVDDGPNGAMSPPPQGNDTFQDLFTAKKNSDSQKVTRDYLSTLRIENPRFHNVENTDCLSCHTSQMARLSVDRLFPDLNLGQKGLDEKATFQSKYLLTNSSTRPEKTTVLRNFGYDGMDPAINQRTVNETAYVLEQLNRVGR